MGNLICCILYLSSYNSYMTHLTIDKKKYVLISEENYQELQKAAALKRNPEKILSIEDARVYSKKLIRKWASEK
jgi:hypothetical protein